MGKSKDSDTLSLHTRGEIIAEIIRRGDALGKKKGTYAAEILDWWWRQGGPAVSEPDRLMQAMHAMEKADQAKMAKVSRSRAAS